MTARACARTHTQCCCFSCASRTWRSSGRRKPYSRGGGTKGLVCPLPRPRRRPRCRAFPRPPPDICDRRTLSLSHPPSQNGWCCGRAEMVRYCISRSCLDHSGISSSLLPSSLYWAGHGKMFVVRMGRQLLHPHVCSPIGAKLASLEAGLLLHLYRRLVVGG